MYFTRVAGFKLAGRVGRPWALVISGRNTGYVTLWPEKEPGCDTQMKPNFCRSFVFQINILCILILGETLSAQALARSIYDYDS
jgi:hypothetical protein